MRISDWSSGVCSSNLTLLSATRIDRLDAVTPGPAQRRGLQGLPRLHIDEPDAPPDEALSVLPGTFLETKVQVSVAFQDCFQEATADDRCPALLHTSGNAPEPRPNVHPCARIVLPPTIRSRQPRVGRAAPPRHRLPRPREPQGRQ